ncbi:MAG: hypothetical protein GY847_10990 [Proteobacteria bacterium]|nr:hypothetical protein [Pseudomonadota bacterium]
MGVNRFFWPQELLDQWMVEDKILLDGEQLTIVENGRTYQVKQAVYFSADVGDGQDSYELVGRVKEISILDKMNAEHYMDSVLIEDSAYQVVPGFAGEPLIEIKKEAGERASDISCAIASQTGEEDEIDDRELLARFLIENL